MTLAAFIGIALLHLAAAISPGPSFVVSVRMAAAEGLRPAIGLAIGLGIGAFALALLALLGLALLFEIAPALLVVFKIVGACFLGYIAWQTWRHAKDPLPSDETTAKSAPRSLSSAIKLGTVTQLANPKPILFFGAVFVGLVPPDTPTVVLAALLAVILLQESLWYILVARLFSLGRTRVAYGRFKAQVDRAFGGLIAALAAKIALT